MTRLHYVTLVALLAALGALVWLGLSVRPHAGRPRSPVPAPVVSNTLVRPSGDEPAALGEKPAADLPPSVSAGPLVPPGLPPVTPSAIPTSDWKDVGSQTPETALETFLWAVTGGDLERVRKLLVLDRVPAEFATYLAKLSPEMRSTHGTPEQIAALMLCDYYGTIRPFERTEVLPPYTPGRNVIWMHVKNDAGTPLVHPIVFQQASDGWRIVVPDYQLRSFLLNGHKGSNLFLPKK